MKMTKEYAEYLKRKALRVKDFTFQKTLLNEGMISQKDYNKITKKIIKYFGQPTS